MTTQAAGIPIAGYVFEGPYRSTDYLADQSGVYAILVLRGGSYHLVDVGESAIVKTRVVTHDRASCWARNQGELQVAVFYTPNLQQAGRARIEQEIRGQYQVPCGIR